MVQIMTKHFTARTKLVVGGWGGGMDRELQAGPGWAEPQQLPSLREIWVPLSLLSLPQQNVLLCPDVPRTPEWQLH